jgi:cystathionine beta-synthase
MMVDNRVPPVVRSTLELIGGTPLVELTRIDTGVCRLFAKLENQNPGGSIKDRVARSMIDAAERDGRLSPGGTIVEATAGNTGIGLAQVGIMKGYHILLVVPDKMAREKVEHLRALGAVVRVTRSDVGKGHPEYYQDKAEKLTAEIPGAFYINQFANPANPAAHMRSTAPEIWQQMEHDVDAIAVGVGSGGTLSGIGTFFRGVSPKTEMILGDPAGSVLAPLINTGKMIEAGSWAVEGIGEDFVPPNADLSLVKKAYSITDKESFDAARLLLAKEGILAGSSSGTILAAALRYCRAQTVPKRVVTLVCDNGNKYLSKVYNDIWALEQGIAERPLLGNLEDLIARRYDSGAAIVVGPEDTLLMAYNRMRAADVSQLPVVLGHHLVGIIDESDILAAVEGSDIERAKRFRGPVKKAMTNKPDTLSIDSPLEALLPIFDAGKVALVCEGDKYYGLITRIDLINHLRLHA